MGFIDNMNKRVADEKQKVQDKRMEEATSFLFEDENIEELFATQAIGSGDDFTCITNKRVITIDKAIISSKKAVFGIPFSRIDFVSLQKGGFMSFSKEVEFFSKGKTFGLKFYDEEQAMKFHKALSLKLK